MRIIPRPIILATSLAAMLTSACANPPDKEIAEARDAIAAARAAGAEQYASQAFKEAADAFARCQAAVTQRDYRAAFAAALESREQAAEAARLASAEKSRLRAEAQKMLAGTESLLGTLRSRVKELESGRLTRTRRESLSEARRTIVVANVALQKAREALGRDDVASARQALEGVPEKLRGAITSLAGTAPKVPTARLQPAAWHTRSGSPGPATASL